MNIIGGIAYRDPARSTEGEPLGALLRGALDLAQAQMFGLSGAVLAGVGPGLVSHHAADGALMADLDLTNLNDLLAASDAPGHCLLGLDARYGIDFLTLLRGAFAIAIWAPARRR